MAAARYGQIDLTVYPPGVKTIDRYQKMELIGEGTYGVVYKARDTETGELVALKKMRLEKTNEGFPISALREIKILSKLDHENVIKLKETVQSPGPERDKPDGDKYKGGVYMVFEYMEHDLAGLIDRPGVYFNPPQIKCYMRQLLSALHYCHVNHVLHRDVKASNLLINNEGILKLADFGLAKTVPDIHVNSQHTNRVITLWYRPPELLLGATNYGPAVDIWSAGCILAELLNGMGIFHGRTEADTLSQIYDVCGVPNETDWPGVSSLPLYYKLMPSRPKQRRLRELYAHFENEALDLLDRMLTLDPAQRINASHALDSDYFWTDPLPSDPKSLPKYKPSHWYEIRKMRERNAILFGSSPESPEMPSPKMNDGSQPESSIPHHLRSRPYPPPPAQGRPSAGSHVGAGSSSGYGVRAPNYPQRYGSYHGSRAMPSSSSHGEGASSSGYGGGAPSQPQPQRGSSSSDETESK